MREYGFLKMGINPKRQHYLPKFYLSGFTRDGLFWVYDRNKNEFRKQTPINTAIEKDYYSFTDKNGKKNTSIEKILADVEGRIVPVINKIKRQEKINDDDKGIMSLFLSILKYRVPEFEKLSNEIAQKMSEFMMKNIINSREQAAIMMKQYEKDTGKTIDISPDVLYEYTQNAQFNIMVDKNTILKQMLDNSIRNTGWLYNMNWVVLNAPKKASFLTTDNPFVLLPPTGFPIGVRGYGLRTNGVKKIIPLSKQQCITIGSPVNEFRYVDVDIKTVRDPNTFVVSRCDRFVIGRDENLLRSIVKRTKIHKWKKVKRIN
ncbi:MAG: DUF4238 domain-containing protein [Bacteroidetes bacterium]|nr:DUF4238 domain-containing protein [Bacteroidota bacterium]